MRPIEEIQQAGEKLGYAGAELREFVKEQQAIEREREVAERAERAAARQEKKLAAEIEQKRIEAAQEQKSLEVKAAREKEKLAAEERKRELELAAEERKEQKRIAVEKEKREAELAAEKEKREAEKEKREAEIELDRERRETEVELKKLALEEERMRLEAAAAQKELDAEVQRARIQAGQDGNSRHTSTSGNGVSAKVPRLPVFQDNKDNLDAYLERFERFATTHQWPRESWASSLSALITGKALEVYSRLSADEAEDFDVLKRALLDRYHLNAEGFRMKLRDSIADEGESPTQFITRLESYLNKWTELAKVPKTFAGMVQLVLTEQFISTCSNDLATFLKERTCESLKELGETANKYLEAHGKQLKEISKKTSISKIQNSSSGKLTCSYCHKMGHTVKECRAKKQAESPDSQQQELSRVECWVCNRRGHKSRDCKKLNEYKEAVFAGAGMERSNVKCFFCDQIGHIIKDCPKRWKKNEKAGCSQEGEDDGTDSEYGAAGYVVGAKDKERGPEVCQPRIMEDKDTEDAAIVVWTKNEGELPIRRGKVGKHAVQTLRDTGCSGVVVKRKFVEDRQLTGRTRPVAQLLGSRERLPVARIHVDTPYLKGEVEALCAEEVLYDLVIGNVHGAREPGDPDLEWEEGGAVETRTRKKRLRKLGVKPSEVAKCQETGVTAVNYLKLQQEDRSLDRLRKMEGKWQKGDSTARFQTEKGILYRIFSNPRVNKGNPVKQVVLPRVLRAQVTALAHDSVIGGHLGVKKTTNKVLLDFFWPGIGEDVKRYCRACFVCQRRKERMMAVQKGKDVHHHDKRKRPKQLGVGDAVLVLAPTENKLSMQWKGPYRVTGVVGLNKYQVKVEEKIRTYHISWLKDYIHESESGMARDENIRQLIGKSERRHATNGVSI